jgi:cbb3-type cytochrome oxidase cytochrome c subunit
MNSGPLLFLGIFATTASSFWGLLLVPQMQIGRQGQRAVETTQYPSARPGLARQGAEVYRALGCVECHSQQVRQTGVEFDVNLTQLGTNPPAVTAAFLKIHPGWSAADADKLLLQMPGKVVRGLKVADAKRAAKHLADAGAVADVVLKPLGPDIQRGWGQRLSVAQDYLHDYPVLLGSQRVGPDLANVGARLPDAKWHLEHLYDPKRRVPGSTMPRYPFLFERRKLAPGQPPAPDAIAQVTTTHGPQEIVPTAPAHALVAYLLSLKTDVPLFEAPLPAKPVTPAPAEATPAPAPPK